MIMNGSQLEPDSGLRDNFPIGLVILSIEKQPDAFSLISINQFALRLFKISPASLNILSDFVKASKSFKEYFFDMCSLQSLYDSVLHLMYSPEHTLIYDSNYTQHGEIISVKMKRKDMEVYITIDDFTEEKKVIRKKLISSIRKNYLMTINHELKNYQFGLITTLEETRSRIDAKDFTTITATVLLIQKIIKLNTLFTKVSFDDIRCMSMKLEESIDLYLIALKYRSKFKEVFLYKNIEMCSIDPLKKIFLKSDYMYLNHFMFVLFLYLYYKVSENGVIEMDIEHLSSSACRVTFSNENNNCSSLNLREVTFDDEIKMNEVQVKRSVMTVDIMEYLLSEISKHLKISIEIVHPPQKMSKVPSKSLNKKLIVLGFNDITVDPKATYSHADDMLNAKMVKKNGKINEFLQKHITYSNPNYTVVDIPFEKKNTYEIFNLKDTVKAVKKSSKDVITNANTNASSKATVNQRYEKVFNEFMENPSGANDNLNKNFEILRNAKFKSGFLCPLLNVDFESDSEEEGENGVGKEGDNLPNGIREEVIQFVSESSNSEEDEIAHQHHSMDMSGNKKKQPIKCSFKTNLNSNDKEKSKKHFRAKRSAKTISMNKHSPFNESTTVYSDSIGKKISHLIATENSIKKILDSITEEEEEKVSEETCSCCDIAVVDDESSIARSMMKILNGQSYLADYCKDGKDCIEKILSKLICPCSKRYYKLILLDVYMIDWGGIKTCHKINELINNNTIPPSMNIVFISGHKLKDLDLPNYPFIKGFYQKPVNKNTIKKILQQYY